MSILGCRYFARLEIGISVDGREKLTNQGVTLCKLVLSACAIAGYLQHMAWKSKMQITWMPKTPTHHTLHTSHSLVPYHYLHTFTIQLQFSGGALSLWDILKGHPRASAPKQSELMQPWEVPC